MGGGCAFADEHSSGTPHLKFDCHLAFLKQRAMRRRQRPLAVAGQPEYPSQDGILALSGGLSENTTL